FHHKKQRISRSKSTVKPSQTKNKKAHDKQPKSRGRNRPSNQKPTPRFTVELRDYLRTHTRRKDRASTLHLVGTANLGIAADSSQGISALAGRDSRSVVAAQLQNLNVDHNTESDCRKISRSKSTSKLLCKPKIERINHAR